MSAQPQLHPGLATIISMPDTKQINKKHPAKAAHPLVMANPSLLPTTPVNYATYSMNGDMHFSMRITEPVCVTTLNAIPGSSIGKNPAYNVNGCYYFFAVPRAEIAKAQVMFQNNQLDELFATYGIYIGQSETVEPSDRAGGRIRDFKADLLKYLVASGAPANPKNLETSSRKVGDMMIARNHLYREKGQPLETMMDCVFYSFTDVGTMKGASGKQLGTKLIERVLIDEYKGNGLLVNT